MQIRTVGSVCSGIEAASVAWEPLGFQFKWFSEIASFPAAVLSKRYPNIPNLGDMTDIPNHIAAYRVNAPDLICAGTPCQAFSLAGWKEGLNDDRGNLSLRFVDIIEASDAVRLSSGQERSIVFWENVEGVLTDKTNAFGCLVSSLAGFDDVIECGKWPSAGAIKGPKRNVAWRVLDAKYFGLPQQRRRLYLIAGGTGFFPENILFETRAQREMKPFQYPLTFTKDGHEFEVFREYTDCLYAAYGTKWNGNAAANNGSLFIVQDGRIRRLSPLECERLMGFPDNYTDLPKAKRTSRYQAIGNSWAVPVVRWIGERMMQYSDDATSILEDRHLEFRHIQNVTGAGCLYKSIDTFEAEASLNCTAIPDVCIFGTMVDIVDSDAPESIYISPAGCYGIVRRSQERRLSINGRLKEVLLDISSEWTFEAIEKRSRVQKRGRYSDLGESYQMTLMDVMGG